MSSPRTRLLRSKMAPLFLARAASRGHDIAPLIAAYGLPKDAAQLPDLALSLPDFRALTARIAEMLEDPLVGLHIAAELPRGTYGIVEFLLRSAPTPGGALKQLARFIPLFNSLLRFSLTEAGPTSILEGHVTGDPLCLGREGNDFVLAVFMTLGRQLTGQKWIPEQVSFAHPRPKNSAEVVELVEFFNTSSMVFGTGTLGFRLKTSDLTRPVQTEDDALHAFLETEARALAARTATDDLEPVREAIRGVLREGEPAVGDVARALGTSARTLQRRLLDHGSSFRAVTDEVRAALARQYIFGPDRTGSLKEVASLLGYADVRAFARAFRRWTGQSPGALRKG